MEGEADYLWHEMISLYGRVGVIVALVAGSRTRQLAVAFPHRALQSTLHEAQ